MSQDDVAIVMYESTKLSADFYRERYRGAEKAILALRRCLIQRAPECAGMDPYDGNAWFNLEQAFGEKDVA